MRILFSIHLYPPSHNAGGELYVHNLATYLISKGHECRVLLHEAAIHNISQIYDHEGVEVFPPGKNQKGFFDWADIVITHLGYTAWTIGVCGAQEIRKPCIFISHNTWVYDVVVYHPWVKVIYNSEAMKRIVGYKNDSIVLHPASDYRKYDLGINPIDNDCITLINLNKNKGGRIFFNIARGLPDRKFLAVKGGYDPQTVEDLPNVEVIENTNNIAEVYSRTRILLVPSRYESWGMCATEAMCNGIPVIYNPTFGLEENVGDAGIKVKNKNPDFEDPEAEEYENPGIDPSNWPAWVKAIKKLDDPYLFLKYSKAGRERSRELDPLIELQAVEQFLFKAIEDNAKALAERYLP